MSSNVPVLIRLELRDVFQIVFFFSQREHYIFLEGVDRGQQTTAAYVIIGRITIV